MAIDISNGGTGIRPTGSRRTVAPGVNRGSRTASPQNIARETPEIRPNLSGAAAIQGVAGALGSFFGAVSRQEAKDDYEEEKRRNEEAIIEMRQKVMADRPGANEAMRTGDYSAFLPDDDRRHRRVVQDSFMRLVAIENAQTDYLEFGRERINKTPTDGDPRAVVEEHLGKFLEETNPAYAEAYANTFLKFADEQLTDWYKEREALVAEKVDNSARIVVSNAIQAGHVTNINQLENLTTRVASSMNLPSPLAQKRAQAIVYNGIIQEAAMGSEQAMKVMTEPDFSKGGLTVWQITGSDINALQKKYRDARRQRAPNAFYASTEALATKFRAGEINPHVALTELAALRKNYSVSIYNDEYKRLYRVLSTASAKVDGKNHILTLAQLNRLPFKDGNKARSDFWDAMFDGTAVAIVSKSSGKSPTEVVSSLVKYGAKLGINAEHQTLMASRLLRGSPEEASSTMNLLNAIENAGRSSRHFLPGGAEGDVAWAVWIASNRDPDSLNNIRQHMETLRKGVPHVNPTTALNDFRQSDDSSWSPAEQNDIVADAFSSVYDDNDVTQLAQERGQVLLNIAAYLSMSEEEHIDKSKVKSIFKRFIDSGFSRRNTFKGSMVDVTTNHLGDTKFDLSAQEDASDQIEDHLNGAIVTHGGPFAVPTVIWSNGTFSEPFSVGTDPHNVSTEAAAEMKWINHDRVIKKVDGDQTFLHIPAPGPGESRAFTLFDTEDYSFIMRFDGETNRWILTADHLKVPTTISEISAKGADGREKTKVRATDRKLWTDIYDPETPIGKKIDLNKEFHERTGKWAIKPSLLEEELKRQQGSSLDQGTALEATKAAMRIGGRFEPHILNQAHVGSTDHSPGSTSEALIAVFDKAHATQGETIAGSDVSSVGERGDVSKSLRATLETHLREYEGLVNNAYNDAQGGGTLWKDSNKKGNPTIGIGYNMNRPKAREELASVGLDYDAVLAGKQDIDTPKARRLLEITMTESIQYVRETYKGLGLTDYQQAALSSLHFNSRRKNGHSTLIGPHTALFQAIKNGDLKRAEWEIRHNSLGRHRNSRLRDGLQRRRDSEADLFVGRPGADYDESAVSDPKSPPPITITPDEKFNAMSGGFINQDVLDSFTTEVASVGSQGMREAERFINGASTWITNEAGRLQSMVANMAESTGNVVADAANTAIKEHFPELLAKATDRFLQGVLPTDSADMLASDFVLKNMIGLPVDRKVFTGFDLRPTNLKTLKAMGHSAWKKHKQLTWDDYGKDIFGIPIKSIIGGGGVKEADAAYPRTAKGFAKLGMATLVDSKVDLALTIGQARLHVEDGELILSDQYDAEKFTKGSSSEGIYGWLRNMFQESGNMTLEKGKQKAIKWRINLGKVENASK